MKDKNLHYLKKAIELASNGMKANDGGPFGAIVVDKNGQIIGQGNNKVTSTNDPTAHAEIVAIRDACKNINAFQLEGCTIYSSCEPCPMCLGAIYWARPDRVIFAAGRADAAKIGFDDDFIYQEIPLAIKDRQIPTQQLLRKEGVAVFNLWAAKEDKVEY